MLMRLLMRQAFAPYALTRSASAATAKSADTNAETSSKENEAKRRTDREGETDSRIDEQTERQRPTEIGRQTDRQTLTDRSPYTQKHRTLVVLCLDRDVDSGCRGLLMQSLMRRLCVPHADQDKPTARN